MRIAPESGVFFYYFVNFFFFLFYFSLSFNLGPVSKGAAADIPTSHSDYDFGSNDLTPISQAKM